ncbi:MAG: lysophospholipid acyltransferase family protein [Planctomycetota bacterium]|jgi:KDO2-lipid IV(A) lauroyltransferase
MTTATEPEDDDPQTYSWSDWMAYLALRLVVLGITVISIERCDRFCRILAGVLTTWIKLRRGLVTENLRRVFPLWSADQILVTQRSMWHHLLLMACEIAHAPRRIHRENWHEHFRISDRATILRVVLDARPKQLVSGHFGNFELAGFLTGLFGIETTTIARPLDNGFIHEYVNRFRSLGGQHLLPKTGSARQIEDLLQAGGALGLLGDQHGGARGCWVDFLGHPASCHKALALFTLSSGAPMMVCSNTRAEAPLTFDLRVLGIADPATPDCPASVPALTRWYNGRLEEAIRRNPEQYWWVHRRWRGEPPKRVKSSSAAAA